MERIDRVQLGLLSMGLMLLHLIIDDVEACAPFGAEL